MIKLKSLLKEATQFIKAPASKSGNIFFSKRDGGFAVRDGDELRGLSTFQGKAKLRKVIKTDKRYDHLGSPSEREMFDLYWDLYHSGGHTKESVGASVKAMYKLANSLKESIKRIPTMKLKRLINKNNKKVIKEASEILIWDKLEVPFDNLIDTIEKIAMQTEDPQWDKALNVVHGMIKKAEDKLNTYDRKLGAVPLMED